MNLYRYAANNPVTFVDPTGLSVARPTQGLFSPGGFSISGFGSSVTTGFTGGNGLLPFSGGNPATSSSSTGGIAPPSTLERFILQNEVEADLVAASQNSISLRDAFFAAPRVAVNPYVRLHNPALDAFLFKAEAGLEGAVFGGANVIDGVTAGFTDLGSKVQPHFLSESQIATNKVVGNVAGGFATSLAGGLALRSGAGAVRVAGAGFQVAETGLDAGDVVQGVATGNRVQLAFGLGGLVGAEVPGARQFDVVPHGRIVSQVDTLSAPRSTLTPRSNKVQPVPGAGPHTGFKRNPQTGEITGHTTFDEYGFKTQRTDITGRAHRGVPTPHTQIYGPPNRVPATGRLFRGPMIEVRPALPIEIPRRGG